MKMRSHQRYLGYGKAIARYHVLVVEQRFILFG